MRAKRAGESALLLLDVVEILVMRRIGYAVVGALAAAVHGAVRASMDADVLVSLGMQEVAGLERALKAAGFDTELRRSDAEDPIPGLLTVSDRHANRVDLLLGLRGLDPQAFARAIVVPFQGAKLAFIGREDFIAMKLFVGGPLDLADAARALSAAGSSIDSALLRRLVERYGRTASEALERILSG